jgi:hypothetical protein
MTARRRSGVRVRRHDERGAALAVAVGIAFVVMLLGMAAITATVSSVTQSGIAAGQVTSTDAAEAGLQYLLAQIETASLDRRSSFSCTPPRLATATITTRCVALNADEVTLVSAGPAPAVTRLLSRCPCRGKLPLTAGAAWVVQATGISTRGGPLGMKTLQALISPDGVVTGGGKVAIAASTAKYEKSAAFSEALFAGGDVSGDGVLKLIGGNTYSGRQSRCDSSGDDLSGEASLAQASVATLSSLVTSFTGACDVAGNLYEADAAGLAITSGEVGQSAYSAGPLRLSGDTAIGGSAYADGPVALSSGVRIAGSVYSGDGSSGITMAKEASVTGDLYSGGPVSVSGQVDGSIFADGPVTLTDANVTGSVYSAGQVALEAGTIGGSVYADKAVTLSKAAKVSGKILASGTGGEPGALKSKPLQDTSASILSAVSTTLLAAANSVNGTKSGTTAAVVAPTLTYDPGAWSADSDFCGATVCKADSVNFVTNNDCNLSSRNGKSTRLDPNSVWTVIKGLESPRAQPTVLQTNCEFSWGDSKEGASLPLDANLAIFDSSGFTFGRDMSGGISSGDGRPHQFYAIVPTSAYLETATSSCDQSGGPDVDIEAPLTDSGDNIQDFVYTPANVCSTSGLVDTYGRVYAGDNVVASSDWDQTFSDIAPWAITTAATGKAATAAPLAPERVDLQAGVPIWVAQVPNPTGGG